MSEITRLVLTRKVYQSINIGGLVTVTVEEVHGKAVRIAVEAPREIAVHRQEIYERILGMDPGEDGGAGPRVPTGPVTGPHRPASRSRTFGGVATHRVRAAVASAIDTAEDRSAVGLPLGGGGDDGI